MIFWLWANGIFAYLCGIFVNFNVSKYFIRGLSVRIAPFSC